MLWILYYGKKSKLTVLILAPRSRPVTDTSLESIEQTVRGLSQRCAAVPTIADRVFHPHRNEQVYGIPRYELQAMLRRSVGPVRGFVTFKFDPSARNDPNRIELADDRIAVRLANMPHDHSHQEGLHLRQPIGDRCRGYSATIGLGLDWAGHSAVAAALLEAPSSDSSITKNMDIAAAVARA